MRQSFVTASLVLALVGLGSDVRADVCNLTTRGSTCSAVSYGGAVFTNSYTSGTYYIDAFLQIKNNTTEQGYNTGGDADTSTPRRDYQLNQTGTTQNLLLSEVPIVTIGGTEYREFLLRIDEPGSDPMLSLDQLQIFLSPNANLTNYTSGTLSGLPAIYDLDSGGDNYIKLNYSLSPYGIAVAYIPNSLFTQSTSAGTQYVYLYSQFGSHNVSGGGMEEWWVRTDSSGRLVQIVPEPASLFLFGAALLVTATRLRRRFR
jgi:hypothetical protein